MAEIIQSTTQQFLDIYDITNNFVILKDGTVSTILTVDAMNFGLLAEEEQDAIMYAYAGLLNSLNYPIQIIINSRTKDVTTYLKLLIEQEETAENETIRRRIRMYREFVGNLIHERNVLDKKFYVVIPAAAVEMGFLSVSSVIPGKNTAFDISTIERSVIIEKAKNLLDPKRDHLIAQFARIGLYSRQLTTQEIIQLFYIQYNPEAVEGQQIGESNTYTTPLVKASIQGNFMNVTSVVPQSQPETILNESNTSLNTSVNPALTPPPPIDPATASDIKELSLTPEVAPDVIAGTPSNTTLPLVPVTPPSPTVTPEQNIFSAQPAGASVLGDSINPALNSPVTPAPATPLVEPLAEIHVTPSSTAPQVVPDVPPSMIAPPPNPGVIEPLSPAAVSADSAEPTTSTPTASSTVTTAPSPTNTATTLPDLPPLPEI